MNSIKNVIRAYILAFAVSWIWEILQSVLYLNYKGGAVTNFILFRAALSDAFFVLILIFLGKKFGKHKVLFIVIGGFVLAVAIEIWALQTGRWEYSSLMPIIPIIQTGLVPTIQLAVTAYFVDKIIFWKRVKGS